MRYQSFDKIPPRLILADQHPLEPFLVRSQEFLCRALSFAEVWPGQTEFWLPKPVLDEPTWRRRAGFGHSTALTVRFGPGVEHRVLGRRCHSKLFHRLWLLRQISSLAAAGERAMFYFRTVRYAHALLPALREAGFPFAFEPHELSFHSARRPERFRLVEAEVYQGAAALFPIGNTLASTIRRAFSSSAPFYVAPLGHNGANLDLSPYDPSVPPRWLYVGSLHRWKGLEIAFEASRDLGVPFDVVGDAGGLERCRQFCAEHGCGHVVFHGMVTPERVASFYRPGTICLLPLSDSEIARSFTSPLKLFEYLAAGRPVLAADLPTVREIVEDAIHARLLPVGDVAAWRSGMEDLLRNRAHAAVMAARGRELARRCTWAARALTIRDTLLQCYGS